MTDVRLFHTYDGGEVSLGADTLVADLQLDPGLETAVYLSLFGGNERDPGTLTDDVETGHPHNYQWWGNIGEHKHAQLRSETGYLLKSLPAVSSNLLRIEDSANRDLAWLKETNVASSITVSASLSFVDSVTIQVTVVVDNHEYVYAYSVRWGV